MIMRCPDCHFMMIQADGCRNCGFSSQKEANDPKDHASDSRKVEGPTGGHTQPPAGQLSLNLF